ncbi:MAG: hypothetical protein WBM57_04720 [Woeseiaceae bacterium]
MKIKLGNATATGNEIFKVVWRGWFYGVLVIFLPFFTVAALIIGFGAGKWEALLYPIMVPLIAAVQGAIAGWLVLLGLKVRPPTNTSLL